MFVRENIFNVEKIHNLIVHRDDPGNVTLDQDWITQFVGQEQDGTLLFTWEDFSPGDQSGALVTYLGTYNPFNGSLHAVFVNEERVSVVNATINRSHTLVGFVTHEYVQRTGALGKPESQGVYRAFLAEIHPQNRVFYLNLERDNYLKLQFVYETSQQGNNDGAGARENQLLVMLHRESIGLYHLPLARVGEKGVIMCSEPRKEQLFPRKWSWCDWDLTYQRLYVLHFVRSGRNERGQMTYQPVFKCYQFPGKGSRQKEAVCVLDVPLDLPIPYVKESTYLNIAPHTFLPDSSINMRVLTLPNGVMCLCYQHSITKYTMQGTIQYSVLLLHKDKAIECTSQYVPDVTGSNPRLLFTWLDGYLCVHLSGGFTHLLCIAPEYDSDMHVLYQHPATDPSTARHSFLLPYVGDKTQGHGQDQYIYDTLHQEVFRLKLDTAAILDLYQSTCDSWIKYAIIHLAAVQKNDLHLLKMLVESVSDKPYDLQTTELLQEFLVGISYSQLRRDVFGIDKRILCHIPYTTHKATHIFKQHAADDSVLSTLSSSALLPIQLNPPSHHLPTDFWTQLTNNLSRAAKFHGSVRYDLLAAKREIDRTRPPESQLSPGLSPSDISSTTSPSAERSTSGPTGLLQKIRGVFHRGPEPLAKAHTKADKQNHNIIRSISTTDEILGKPPEFLLRKEDHLIYSTSRYFFKTVELLSSHLIHMDQTESRTKCRSVSECYVKAQCMATRLVCHIIHSVCSSAGGRRDITLSTPPCEADHKNLMLLERLIVAASQISFPMPSGLNEYLLPLCLRCNGPTYFLSCVREGGIYAPPTPGFVARVMQELPDTPQNVSLKTALLQTLPQDGELMSVWSHPTARHSLVAQYAQHVLSVHSNTTQSPSHAVSQRTDWNLLLQQTQQRDKGECYSNEHQSHDVCWFPPAVALVKYLHKKGLSGSMGRPDDSISDTYTGYLHNAAMAHIWSSENSNAGT